MADTMFSSPILRLNPPPSSLSEEVAFALAQGLKTKAITGMAVMMTVSDGDMTKLTNIPASEAGPPLAEHGENPKDSQLPQFTHFRSKFSTTILVLNIRHSLSHTSWKRVNVFPSLTLL
ncbi:BnaC04g14040D [Brassica napus]|uniref:BnaC04g14040D protein n=1 Tax=Brassica napus TaxID=3708 RepID=A0A078HR59_BRANA|nr:BnaC04g14040D [Brassica napus]